MTSRRRDYDEDDVKVRPPRRTRPRTKERPSHDDAVTGFVRAVDRGRYTCRVEDRDVTAMKARELGRRGVAVGDQVALVGDVSGRSDTLARIVRVHERRSVLRRTADDTDPVERVIVANAEQLVIVASLAEPGPRLRLIDRCLVAAYDAGLRPLLCLTKADLASADVVLGNYRALHLDHVVIHRGAELEPLVDHLRDRVSVLVGPSGVGKSTLVNRLVPGATRATGAVNAVTGRGRHTSSSAVALALPDGGWVIDTPGVRSFGLAHIDLGRVIEAFPDLASGTEHCPRGCGHDEPECGLDEWVAGGHADQARLDSLRRLLRTRDREDDPAG